MKRLFFISCFLFLVSYSKSQNLVPNGDFEFYTSCPSGSGQINLASPWHDPTGATSDYFNGCAPVSSLCSVPDQTGGVFQYAHSGVGYAGLWVMQSVGSNYREYIQVAFIDSLKMGRCYSVSFYTNLSNLLKKGANNLGAYISQTAINTSTPPYVLNYNPQILLPGNLPIIDTLNWIKISDVYQAVGGERNITIGNFKDDSNTVTQIIDTTSQFDESYYYIDDVSVSEIKNTDAGKDSTICNGNSVQLGNANYQGVTYNWQPTTGLSNATIGNPIASPVQTTTYYLTQTTPCAVSKDTVIITVCVVPPVIISGLVVPNIFTPNNDGINDVFRIVTKNIATLNCKIYNRWGILVNELTKFNEAWDGRTTSGIQCSTGVYYYTISAIAEDGKAYDEKGFVELVK